jgi:hypothetical protein
MASAATPAWAAKSAMAVAIFWSKSSPNDAFSFSIAGLAVSAAGSTASWLHAAQEMTRLLSPI